MSLPHFIPQKNRESWLECIPVLILLGMLAGALGGLAIGAMSLHSSSSTTSQAQ